MSIQTSSKFEERKKKEEKDLCKTCVHYWLDFPMPLDHYESRCEVMDKQQKYFGRTLDEVVPFPCLKCPFDSYLRKEE